MTPTSERKATPWKAEKQIGVQPSGLLRNDDEVTLLGFFQHRHPDERPTGTRDTQGPDLLGPPKVRLVSLTSCATSKLWVKESKMMAPVGEGAP